VITMAWLCVMAGLGLGLAIVPIPGLPGSAVALLGLVAFAALTDFSPVGHGALVVGAMVAGAGTVGQIVGAPIASRALGGSAGAATGAAAGALTGVFLPVPGATWVVAGLGALVGALVGGGTWRSRAKGVVGAAGGCLVSSAWDLLGVLGVGAVLAVSDLLQSAG
jgi:uncharacterized protein YqgC (DUF456 family)